ncbi:MAG: MFS transporter [Actinobacteria bacterium]|nr:MFS transporter [Actinomycetota bacterium]
MTRRRRAGALVAIATSQLLALSLWFSATAVAPQLEALWELSTTETAGLTVAVQIGFAAGALLLAALGVPDALRARTLFVAAAAVGAAANAAVVLVRPGDVWLVLLLRALTGAALAGVYPSGLKVMAGWFRSGRGMALGALVGALTVGSAAPHLLRGLGAGWEAVVLGASGLAVCGALLMAFSVSDGPYETPRQHFSWTLLRRVVRNRGVRLATLGYLGHMWELYAMWTWTAAFLAASARASGGGDAWVPIATFCVIALGGVGAMVAGLWADRHGRERLVRHALAGSASCALATPLLFGATPLLVVPVFAVWGIAVIADSAQLSALVTEAADAQVRGTALTLQLALGFAVTLVTIPGVGWIAEAAGWRWALAGLALGPAAGYVAISLLERAGGTTSLTRP